MKLQEWITTLELQKSDLELYGRRVCIRVDHLSVESEKTADSIYEKTGEFLREECPVVPVSCIDWVHHIGSEYNSYRNKKNNCSIIVRFTSSRHRIMFYRNTKVLKDVHIKLNLTKRKKIQIYLSFLKMFIATSRLFCTSDLFNEIDNLKSMINNRS